MSLYISAKEIRKSFGVRPLFENLTFVVKSADRIGLIGPNGAGKSTLLKILAGKEVCDGGELSILRGLKIGFLEQAPRIPAGLSVEEAVFGEAESPALAGQLLSKLELTQKASTLVDTLSGGWKKRVALARELVKSPELLLLDEPTNHLDIESILWLEEFLARSRIATVTITHDRLFLQRVANRIVELDKRYPNGILSVTGDYATFLERREELLQVQFKEEKVLKNTLRRETEWLRRGPKARTTKQQARISAAEELKNQVEDLEQRNQTRSAKIDFQSHDKKPKRLIEAMKISKRYGEKVLFEDLDVFVGPKSRIGLLGANGTGKSTLIRVLLGSEEPDTGRIVRSEHLKVAYFEQNRETLDPKVTLRKTLCPHGDHVLFQGKQIHIQGYLDRFLFKREQTDMLLGQLSGGEQARVLIARLMQQEANILVLDEPTNDLDVPTLDVLQECLTQFEGAILLVTHDRYFLDQVATQILAFPQSGENTGNIVSFADLYQWENWQKQMSAPKKAAVPKAEPPKPNIAPKRKLSFNESRELAGMEEKIHSAEMKLQDLEKESQLSENIANPKKLSEIFTAMAEAQRSIEKLYARWAELETLTNK